MQAGLLINIEKSNFQPVQSIEWLGLLWDSKSYSLFIPNRRVGEVQSTLNFLINSFPLFTARELAKFAGQIISLSPVYDCVCSLMTRNIYLAVFESRGHWDHLMNLAFPDLVKTELEFWTNNLVKMNYKRLIAESLPSVLSHTKTCFVIELIIKIVYSVQIISILKFWQYGFALSSCRRGPFKMFILMKLARSIMIVLHLMLCRNCINLST